MTIHFRTDRSPFPYRIKSGPNRGRIILDEECTCGHVRSDHCDTTAYGHGACAFGDGVDGVEPCPCSKFTWARAIHAASRNP
jgi:hypothetical protein